MVVSIFIKKKFWQGQVKEGFLAETFSISNLNEMGTVINEKIDRMENNLERSLGLLRYTKYKNKE